MREAVLLTGSLGLGHESRPLLCQLLERSGWQTRNVQHGAARPAGWRCRRRVFGRPVAMPGMDDGRHFAHLRTG